MATGQSPLYDVEQDRIVRPEGAQTLDVPNEPRKVKSWVDRFEPAAPIFDPLWWRCLVQIPQPPKTSEGGIILADETRENEEFASYVGYLSAIGASCFKAVTRSQIHLAHEDVPKVGDWVIFSSRAGEKHRDHEGNLWVVMSDTEIKGIAHDPSLFDCVSL